MKKVTPGGLLRLAKLGLRNYWFLIAWIVACVFIFRCDYLHYKKAPQYYYLRRMLGLGVCISRGTAALLNVGIFLLVLPVGRSFLSLVRGFLPLWLNLFCDSFLPSSKTMHLMIAVTILLTSVTHSISHIANAINFSRHYIANVPEVNMASYEGESPVMLIFTSVPGITGVSMLLILTVMWITSWKCVRIRQFEVFYYTHYCCVLFLLILLIHPLSGVLKGVLNVDSHPPGCRFARTITALDENGVNAFRDAFDRKEGKNQNKNGKEPPLFSLFAETPNMSERGKPYIASSKRFYGSSHSYSSREPTPTSQKGRVLLKAGEEELKHNTLSKDEDEYREILQELFDYPEPEPEPFEEVFGYPEPSDELGYPDLVADIQRTVPEETVSGPRLNVDIEISGIQQESFDRLRHGTKRKIKYCLKPPLFVTIESKTWLWVLMTLLYLFIDFLIKHWRGQQEVEVLRVREFPGNVLELTLRKQGFHCTPGQFIMLRCPKVARYQWHPFTVSQCPSNKSGCFTILIRTKGNWCKKLRNQVYLSLLRTEQPSKITLQNHVHKVRTSSELRQSYINPSLWKNSNFESTENESGGRTSQQKRCFRSNHVGLYRLPSVNRYENGRESDVIVRSKIPNTLSSGLPKYVNENGLSKCHLGSFHEQRSRTNTVPCPLSDLSKYYVSHLPNHSHLFKKLSRTSVSREDNDLSRNECKCLHHASSCYLKNASQSSQGLYNGNNPIDCKSGRPDVCFGRFTHKQNKFAGRSCSLRHDLNKRCSGYQAANDSASNHEPNDHSLKCQDSKYNFIHPSSNSHNLRYHDSHYVNPGRNLTQNVQDSQSSKGSKPKWAKLRVLENVSVAPSSMRSFCRSENSYLQDYPSYISHEGNGSEDYCPYVLDIEGTQHLRLFRLFFDGPFTSPNEAVLTYPVVIGIVGGIGVTPLLASLSKLRNYLQPNPRRLHIVWVLRELPLILPLAPFFQSLIELFWARKEEDRLEVRFHWTGSVADCDFISLLQNQYPFLKARLHRGRPNWDDLFDVWKESYRKCMVGVFCCGPNSLNKEIRNYTLQALGQGLNFNYHHESFS